MRVVLLTLVSLVHFFSSAQTGMLTGTVVDAETQQPIPFAHVFISNTTHVSVTDVEGQFVLAGIRHGAYQMAVSFLGYETFTRSLQLADAPLVVSIKLTPQTQSLENVVVSGTEDKTWKKNLRIFKRQFLGETGNARLANLMNPWVLEFERKGASLRANATQPVEIQNASLGYRLFFYLQQFEASAMDYTIVGPVRFQEMEEPQRQKEWEENRASVFHGSVTHFLHSLHTNQAKKQGFKMYQPVNALQQEERSLYFERDLGVKIREVQPKDVLRKVANGYTLSALKPVEVHYEPGQDFQPVYKDVLHPVSWIQSTSGLVKFDSLGNITNPKDIIVVGYWNRLRVADLLPLDYRPGGRAKKEQPRQSVEIVTNKDVFQLGEKVWYTILVSGHSVRKDGMSVRVDLIDSANQLIASRLDPVELRKATGYFELPADESKRYFLRATTMDMHQRGECYVKPIVALPLGYSWAESSRTFDNKKYTQSFVWIADTTKTERVLQLWLTDVDQDTLFGNFLVSAHIEPLCYPSFEGRSQSFSAPKEPLLANDVMGGAIKNAKGKPLKGRLSFVTSDLSYSFEKTTDEAGRFLLEDLVIYDSVEWVVQFFNEKGKPQQDFKISWNNTQTNKVIPNLTWPIEWRGEKKTVQPVVTQIKIPNDEYKLTAGTRLLEEVTVKARKDVDEQPTFRTYGSPQHVVKGQDLMKNPAGTNVLSALVGRVPGMVGAEVGTSWTGFSANFNARGTSSFYNEESPLIIIDGVPMDDYKLAYDILQTIPLTDIDRVEVRTGLSAMQAFKRGNGTIAVYTKRTGLGANSLVSKVPNPFVRKVTLQGYSKPKGFAIEGIHQGSTVHWDSYASFRTDKSYVIGLPKNVDQITLRLSGFTTTGDRIELIEKIKFND